jgi:hypothetical protein
MNMSVNARQKSAAAASNPLKSLSIYQRGVSKYLQGCHETLLKGAELHQQDAPDLVYPLGRLPSRPQRKYFIENICTPASEAQHDVYQATHKKDALQKARPRN